MANFETVQTANDGLIALAENLNKLMFEKGVDVKTLNLSTGISISAINALKRGVGNPTLGTLLELAKFFNTSIDQLIGFPNQPRSFDSIRVPIYNITDVEHRNKEKIIEYIIVSCESFEEHDIFGVKIHNNAMLPFFEKGSLFILSADLNYSDGDVVLINLPNNKAFFRKIFNIGDRIQFNYISAEPSPHSYDQFKVIGVVIKVIQSLT